MLNIIRHVIEKPNDFPDVPRAVKEHLQVRFNYTYLVRTRFIATLRQEGHSEAYIAGVIDGLEKASAILDEIETRKDQLREA